MRWRVPLMAEFMFKVCPVCGIEYAAPQTFFAGRDDGRSGENKNWFCPNGHSLVFSDSEINRLRRERDRLQQQIAAKDDEIAAERRRRVSAEKKTKRVQKRAHAGVCPCCNRTFQDVVRHMQTKHPDVALLAPRDAPKVTA